MANLSIADVLKLAKLSKLELSQDELDELTAELSEILNYVEMLGKVDVKGLEPTAQVTGLVNVTRKDEIIDYGATPDELLKNAPALDKHQIKVKRVLG